MKPQICKLSHFATALSLLFSTLSIQASPIYQSPGPNFTFGDVLHGKGVVSGAVNPAAPAADQSLPRGINRGCLFALGGSVEYGNFDDIFDFIDQATGPIVPDDTESRYCPGTR